MIATQTVYYQRAGVSHDDAACLANVTGRMRGPGKDGTGLVIASREQDEAIRNCHMQPGALEKIGKYVRSHPPK